MINIERYVVFYLGLLLFSISVVNPVTVVAESQFRLPVVVTDVSPGTFSLVAVDLDKDGDIDIVVASSINDTVAWYENSTATGEVWIPHLVSSVADGVIGVNVADIDRDGDADIVSASTLDDKLRWHENLLGNGVLWNDHTIGIDIDGIIGMVVEDFDQDLDWDVAAVSNLNNQVLWFENTTGDASDGMVHVIASNASGAFPLEKGDLDGDGDQDLISGWSSSGVLAWHENVKNQGGSWVTRVLDSNLGIIRSIAVDDINGDGAMDVVAAVSDIDSIFWFQPIDILQGVWQRNTVSTNLDGVLFVDTADLDNDGDMDVLAAADGARNFVVYENGSGVGSNWKASVISSATLGGVHQDITNGPRTIRPADVNGDGLLDIITGSYWGQTVAVLIQQGADTLNNTPTVEPGLHSTATATTVAGSSLLSQDRIEESLRPSPIVIADSDVIQVEAESGVVEIVQPTAPSIITGLEQCAIIKILEPSWETTFQVKLSSRDLASIPMSIQDQSLCFVNIDIYDAQAVKQDEMVLWQPATITIPLSDAIIQQLSANGIYEIEGIMKAVSDRRLILVKRHLIDGTHWIPVATGVDLLGRNITTRLSTITGAYALILVEAPLPLGYVLPSVGAQNFLFASPVIWVLGILLFGIGWVVQVRLGRGYRFR